MIFRTCGKLFEQIRLLLLYISSEASAEGWGALFKAWASMASSNAPPTAIPLSERKHGKVVLSTEGERI